MNLKGKVVTLRAMEKEDMGLMQEMVNDPALEYWVEGYSFPVSKEQQYSWYERNQNDSNNLKLIIETDKDGAIGYANIINIDWKNRSAFHGIKIANKEFRSKGIGTDTVMTVMKYAFEELQLDRLDGSIIDYNTGSQRLYINKCGWVIEGKKRKSVFKKNSYHDTLMVGILKEEYFKLIEENNYWDDKG